MTKIHYRTLQDILESAEEEFDKNVGELKEEDRELYDKMLFVQKFSFLKSAYNMLCLQVQKHNVSVEANDILN
jgi:hypothetical protein